MSNRLFQVKGTGMANSAAQTSSANESEPTKTEPQTLLMWLDKRAEALGHDKADMAKELGVTYGYIAQLRSGIRLVCNISDDFAQSCAEYLRLPRIVVLRAAGRIRPCDYVDPHLTEREIEQALNYIRSDPEWGAFLPADVFSSPLQLQHYVVTLYEKATGKQLVTKATESGELSSD